MPHGKHLEYILPGTASKDGNGQVEFFVDHEGYIEITCTKYDWVCAYANLSKEQMAEVGRFLLEAVNES